MRRGIRTGAALALVLALTGCASGAPVAEPSSSRPPFLRSERGAVPGAPTGTPVALPPERWDAVVADLARRAVSGEPTLVSAESVVFADGSLGCPEPGQNYTQAQVEGMRVIVDAGGTRYDYRFGRGDAPRLCTR
jgi:hypothetical protein